MKMRWRPCLAAVLAAAIGVPALVEGDTIVTKTQKYQGTIKSVKPNGDVVIALDFGDFTYHNR